MKKKQIVVVNNEFLKVIELVLNKIKKYESIGRLDKSFYIIKYLNSIYLILKYWDYSKLPYSELPKCIENTIECSLQGLKNKLKILPRELYIDISKLLENIEKVSEGINNLEIISEEVKNNKFVDNQVVI